MLIVSADDRPLMRRTLPQRRNLSFEGKSAGLELNARPLDNKIN